MKLLVIQEQHFVRMPNGEVWVDEQSDSEFWKRYLSIFEEVVVCARFTHSDVYNTNTLVRSDQHNVTFAELPNSRGVTSLLKNFITISKIMRRAMTLCDRIIFRAPSPISMIAYPLAKSSGKPYATEIMNNPYTHFSPKAMNHFYQPFLRWLIVEQTKSLCKSANGVSYVTEQVLQKMYPSQARLKGETKQHFEGSFSTIRMEPERYTFVKWPDQKPECVTFIHTGKMQDNRKGQDVFIKVISLLITRGYNVKGILVGDGEKRSTFEDMGHKLKIAKHLEFVGWKAGFEAVKVELERAHFAVFPSVGEGLPRSVIEGMAQGLLCFGTEVDGICELLSGDCLVSESTAECFADHIELFLNDWPRVLRERKLQFEYSQKYEYSLLKAKRSEFYIKLKEASI